MPRRAPPLDRLPASASADRARFLEAVLASIPDCVYAFDRQRRFAYTNPAMLGLFGLSAEAMIGKTFVDLGYPAELAARLNGHIDHVLRDGCTIADEVYFRSPTGHAAFFSFLWGPVHAEDGSVDLVVGVSRETTARRAMEEELRRSGARLRAATELAKLGIYSWNPVNGAFQWDERLRTMWGLPTGASITQDVFEAGIHPDDLPRVQGAIAACIDPAGDGCFDMEYRVVGRDDGVTRHVATSGQATFAEGRAVGFIGAALDITTQRLNEAAIRASEAQFRSFAQYSSNVIWMGDPEANTILYRNAAYERIWGVPAEEAPTAIDVWMRDVHPDDRPQVEHALASVKAGEVAQVEYRIVRPQDGGVRLLRDTSFPIPDESGAVVRIGGITEDLTPAAIQHAYVVSTRAAETRRLAGHVRALGYRTRTFESAASFLKLAPVLAPGCALIDLRSRRDEGLSIPRELKARSVSMPTIALDAPGADVDAAVDAMKAGVIDYLVTEDEEALRAKLAKVLAECHLGTKPPAPGQVSEALIARLTPRERDVLAGLVEGGTNKSIGLKLGISPRTVELHRAQVMGRLHATSLAELLQIALAAGVIPPTAGH